MRAANNKKRSRICVLITLAVLLSGLIAVYCLYENNAVEITHTEVSDGALPESFQNFVIAHVSDLHSKYFGDEQEKIIALLNGISPDIIVVTGDLIDSYSGDTAPALCFLQKAVKVAPVYYVTGNHEARLSDFENIREQITDCGVNVLTTGSLEIVRGSEKIYICGADDLSFYPSVSEWENAVSGLKKDGGFTVLLAHRPEYIDFYEAVGFNLVFSGHAHGGQVRLPFIGGLAAPGQGIFPEYTYGLYSSGNTQMYVSRGLGNSILPLRINDRPELAVITLCSE